jgi:hypothetical protein
VCEGVTIGVCGIIDPSRTCEPAAGPGLAALVFGPERSKTSDSPKARPPHCDMAIDPELGEVTADLEPSARNMSTCLRQWVREFSEAFCRDVGSERNSFGVVTGNRLVAIKVSITPRW